MIGIINWRMEQCASRGVEFRFDTFAEAHDVLEEKPDVVLIATGGCPHTDILKSGNDLVVSAWDIISGSAKLEIMTPDRSFAPEVMAMNLVPYMRTLQKLDVTFTVTFGLEQVGREGQALVAVIGSDYGGVRQERRVDQVVVNRGTIPNDDLYFALKPNSRNLGAIDHDRLITGLPQAGSSNPQREYQLFRIGDAVSARNTHAAIYDALRLVKDL